MGGLRPGCEIDGQGTAPLRAPLEGWATFSGAIYPIPIGVPWLKRNNHTKMSFVIDPSDCRVESIAIPVSNICE
jgi:hypothetical protein